MTTQDSRQAVGKTLVDLVLASDINSRMIGLYLINENYPMSALALYMPIGGEDNELSELCGRAIASIEPLYRNYLPQLKERYRESEASDQKMDYVLSISMHLLFAVREELGEQRMKEGPMGASFFS
jgi:hypothetical protein